MSDHKKEYGIIQIALNLTAACLVSGLIIAGTYFFTHPIALKNAKILEQQSMKALVPNADVFEAINGKDGWFTAGKDGAVIAYVVPGESKGYGGSIKMLVAVSTDGTVIDFSILSANETPGLGDKAAKLPFRERLQGKTPEDLVITKDPSNTDNVLAMTGATITSTAVTNGVREAAEEVAAYMGGAK
ncbi:MAG: FMN-binding protein [Clostridiales bacterium]|nr:FMN-binding protein [Clostridiales bacterium]